MVRVRAIATSVGSGGGGQQPGSTRLPPERRPTRQLNQSLSPLAGSASRLSGQSARGETVDVDRLVESAPNIRDGAAEWQIDERRFVAARQSTRPKR